MMTSRAHLMLLPLLALSLACGHKESAPSESASTGMPPAAAPSAPSAPSASPAPNAPAAPAAPGDSAPGTLSSRGETVPAGGAPAAQGAGLDFDLPASWKSQPPESQMRLAQAAIPGPGGDGQLAVFFFGPGGGGSVEANIQRWIDQMEPAKGSAPKPETFQTGKGFKVTWVDVSGVLKPSSMGTGPAKEQPGSRLLGAVVEGPGGPWFFKVTGPDSTIAGQRDAFLTLLKSVRSK